MFRTLATLIVVTAVTPAAIFASGPTNTNKNKVTTSTQKGSATAKLNQVNTTPKVTVDAAKKFPKVNNGYQTQVSKATLNQFANKNFDKTYHLKCGTKFDHGFCYHGQNHCHWSFCCWDSYCGCYTYWCPCTCCFYYYCQPYACFYPVTYCPCQTYVFTNCYVVPSIPVAPVQVVSPQ